MFGNKLMFVVGSEEREGGRCIRLNPPRLELGRKVICVAGDMSADTTRVMLKMQELYNNEVPDEDA